MLVRAACIAGILLCAGLYAQQKSEDTTTRTVEGLVTNAANQPWRSRGAIEEYQDIADPLVHHARGRQLSFRDWEPMWNTRLRPSHDGVHTSWKTLSIFNSKKTPVINLKLKK
jgi:hypothetical protein